jgi:hypothetical protein
VRRDARAHGACAEYNGFLDAMSHDRALCNGDRTVVQVTKPASRGQTGVW